MELHVGSQPSGTALFEVATGGEEWGGIGDAYGIEPCPTADRADFVCQHLARVEILAGSLLPVLFHVAIVAGLVWNDAPGSTFAWRRGVASWRSVALGRVPQRWGQAGVGEDSEAAVFVEVDHDGLTGATAQQEGHDAVVAGGGEALAAGPAVDHQ